LKKFGGLTVSITRYQLSKRKRALDEIKKLSINGDHLLVIHYSCESFYDIKDGRTPRITSIAVRLFRTGQTKSFSIHKMAERQGMNIVDIEGHYDELEKAMLEEFYKFVADHKGYNWLHWNMRDISYGFEAIEHRFLVLQGTPVHIEDNLKFDLARLLVDIYRSRYIGHSRLERLVDKNSITKKEFLSGEEEATAFENKEFVKLHQSTLRKVDILQTILERTLNNSLKTNSNIRDTYGLSPQGLFELVKDNWAFLIIWILLMVLLGAVVGKAI
jgi:hypothetical protein